MKNLLARLLSFLVIASILAGCSKEGGGAASPADSSSGTAAADEAANGPFIYYCRTNAGRESAPDNPQVLAYIQEQTGIQMEINAIAQDSFKEKIDLMLASNEAFDGMNLIGYADSYSELAEKKAIIPINELIEKHGPAVNGVMAPGLYSSTDKDGQIWALPRAERFPEGYVPTIREDWLEALGLSMPRTIEELEAYFDAVLANDPNGNGDSGDEIAYLPNMLLYGISNFIPYFLPVKDGNLSSTGFSNLNNLRVLRYMADDGSIRSVFTHPDFINILAKFREWYEKGYMPKDIHLLKTAQLTDIRTSGVAGSLGGWFSDGNTPIINWNEANPDKAPGYYAPIPPLENAPGRSMWPSNPTYAPQIVFMRTGKNHAAMMRYFDWICQSSQNTATVQYGIEGVHWNWSDEGKSAITLSETAVQNYLEYYSLANLWWKGLMPEVLVSSDNKAEYMRTKQMEEIRAYEMNYPFDAHIPYNYKNTDAEFLTADGATLLEEAIIKIIIGESRLEDWPAAVATYNSIEGDILSQVWTEQYNDFVS
ncbi:MAG: extracellular solute-binding protein [Clostridiales bacterium]|jgi:putative aldouronate transport system substrate-binding protein|nr:extracellular solute-binding protein [Clostridiales bacterium]